MESLANKSVLVLGLGDTGLSMLRYLKAQGARVRAADSRADPPGLAEAKKYVVEPLIHCGEFDDELFIGVELIAISPGVPLRTPVVARAVVCGIPVMGDIELFAQALPEENRPRILAITGANGKTTVTSMVEHLCKAAGKDAVAAGNISPPVLDALAKRAGTQPEIWVLELSSFQLETTATLKPDAATVLNISEDHLDRYDDMDEYAAAKARIFNGAAVQVLNRDDARSMAMAREGCKQITFGLGAPGNAKDFGIVREKGETWLAQGTHPLLKTSELQVAGLHNAANALAALALCSAIGLPMPAMLAALRSFKGLPHRVEQVAEINGVIYYDDSKGTNVGATVAALEGLGGMTRCAQASGAGMPPSAASRTGVLRTTVSEAERKVVLIAGGEGKGQDFSPLNAVVGKHARAAILIGRDAELIAAALQDCGVPVKRAKDMSDAVQQAAQLAQSGDAVLLSPACASFDMFRNYAHRAEVFVKAVHDLISPNSPVAQGGAIEEGAWHR